MLILPFCAIIDGMDGALARKFGTKHGARALQISMGAPVDIKVPVEIIDPVIIAQMEYDTDAIPIDIVEREKK